MIRWTEMNSAALICLAYISDFCRTINKFTCKSIMHDFIFIISTTEAPRLPAFHPLHTEKLAAHLSQASTVSALCQIVTVYSAKHSIIKCFAVKNSNEIEIVKWSHRRPFILPSRYGETRIISKTFSVVSNYWKLLSFLSSEPSLICWLQQPWKLL